MSQRASFSLSLHLLQNAEVYTDVNRLWYLVVPSLQHNTFITLLHHYTNTFHYIITSIHSLHQRHDKNLNTDLGIEFISKPVIHKPDGMIATKTVPGYRILRKQLDHSKICTITSNYLDGNKIIFRVCL